MIKQNLLKEAYKKIGKNIHTDEMEFIGKVLEEYQTLDSMEIFDKTPNIFFTSKQD